MQRTRSVVWIWLVLLLAAPAAWSAPQEHAAAPEVAGEAAEEAHEEAAEAHEFDPVHHSADGYYLDFSPLGEVELPRLFLVRRADGGLGLDVFATTRAALHSGAYTVADYQAGLVEEPMTEEIPGDHLLAPQALPPEAIEALIEHHAHLDAELVPLGGTLILDLSVTRHLVFAILGALIVLVIFLRLAGRYRRGVGRETAPRGLFQNLFETMIVFVRDEIAKPTVGDRYKRVLPYLLTVFFFILTCNLLGLIPFGATATSNLMITAVLAIFTFVITQFNGSKDHWHHIFWPPGVPVPLKFILIPIEILGLFTKPFALAIRLFANMTAGHLVILSLLGLIFAFANIFGAAGGYGVSPISVGFALFIYLLELLVAFIQAYVFTMLSALFIGMAAAEHPHEPEEGELPEYHGPDHSHVTPHLIGDGA